MANVIKVALPGVNALTDTNPKNFSLYSDQSVDHVLVKEQSRDTIEIPSFTTETIDHDLGYFPFNVQMVEVSSGEFQWIYNTPGGSFNPFYSYVTTSDLILRNSDGSARDFTYILFYDQI